MDEFFDNLLEELAEIAKKAVEDIKDELIRDGKSFVEKTRADLQRWAQLLVEGKITRDEFEYLVKAKRDLAQMEALKQKGLAQVRIDKLRNALLNAVVDAAERTFL